MTRVRGAGFNPSGLPDEALDTLLERHGYARDDVTRYAIAEPGGASFAGRAVEQVDHHLAHACAAYLSSPFSSAAIVVCDHELPKVSVWEGRGADLTRVEWPWEGPGFADLYSACAQTLGFASDAGDQRLEALARLRPGCRDARLAALFTGDGTSLTTEPAWQGRIEDRVPSGAPHGESPSHAAVAAALQGRIGELFLELLTQVARRTACTRLCLAGSFFYHSSINTLAKCAGLFSEVFVPIDPGNPGLAVGTALHVNGCDPRQISPFLGPAYEASEIKETLDNCKLRYDWNTDEAIIETAVNALRGGALVGWFEGPMEWGARALGGRSILANPFLPYTLENLNRFLKRREPWRGYALSAPTATVTEHFDGPEHAPFMECDYRPRDPSEFRCVLPSPEAAVRIHTLGPQSPPRFRRLIEAFGEVTGMPCLVNTSFNGFHEPIVCSPRDAVRVFYGSGVDVLVLEHFLLTK